MYYIHHHYRHLCFVSSVRLFSPLFRLSSLTLTPHPLSPSYPILYHLLHLHRIPRCFSLRGGLGKFVLVPHLIFNHLRSSDCAHGDTSPGVGYKLVGRRSQLRRRLSVTVARTSLARNSRRSGLFVTVTTIWCWSASAWTVGVVWSSRV